MMTNIRFGTYIFFGVFCLLSGFWAMFLVPETRGKTLEQIDELFGDFSGDEERRIMGQVTGAALSPEK